MSAELYPATLEELIEEFGRLPGIGRKTASRLAFHILNSNESEALALVKAVIQVKKKIKFCARCFNLSEQESCSICRDNSRNKNQICVVEDPSSLIMIEKTNEFHGLYHVLGGTISPLDGIGPEDLHMNELINRARECEEVILALNPSTEGEATSIYLSKALKPFNIKITRLARGIPLGGHLEFVDELTLSKALKSRLEL
jgi:recombination protein RecR